ncbi:MAG: hypothetical protein GX862_04915 [Leucobacter sp.]|nr:hypothetical protein [Leucobacter sp.]
MTEQIIRPPGRLKRKITSALAALTLAVTALGGSLFTAPAPAHALGAYGAGAHGWAPNGSTWLGNFILPDGTRVYCIDIYNGSNASSDNSSVVSGIPASPSDGRRAVSGSELQWLNYLVTMYGQTADTNQAAAVSALVYNVTSMNNHDTDHYISVAPAEVQDLYWSIKSAVNANYQSGGGSGAVTMTFDVDPLNNYLGTLSVSGMSPSNALGTITLTNGVFTDTGLATRDGVTNNSSYPVTGVPPEDATEYIIAADGAFTASGGVNADIRYYRDGDSQGSISGGSRGVSNFTQYAEDPAPRSTVFQPVVGTQVASKFVEEGEEFADVLTFSTAADAKGLNNPWRVNAAGRYMPITARGTLYGPFLAQPDEADAAPSSAPIAATDIMVTTTAEDGPTIDYTVPSGFVSEEAGFYTWVWEILASDQPAASPNVQQFLPQEYHFTDRFGQVVETSITPSNLAITTAVTESMVGIGQDATDEVTVTPYGGGWIQADGGRVPATLTGTAYYSETQQELADSAPAGAEVVGTPQLVVNKAGTVTSDPITMPLKEGWVTFQWCLVESEQPVEYQGMLAETCDQYGQASETVQVTAPTVTTQARELATVHDPLFDVATVNGPVPADTVVSFELFQKPEEGNYKYAADGSLSTEVWTQDEIDALADDAVCTVENRVTVTDGVAVAEGQNDAAQYQSPNVYVDQTGTYWWVESLIHVPTGTVIKSGICGLENETTIVDEPTVTTKAQTDIHVGEKAADTAIVTGPIPGENTGITTELTFEAFKQTGSTPVCTVDNRVADLSTPVAVTGAGEYLSEAVTFDEAGTYFWVETLTYVLENGDREIVHVGECGEPSETTIVTGKPVLSVTGASGATMMGVGAGALLLVAAGLALVLVRRKRGVAAE